MNREQYLQRLAAALGKLGPAERDEILADYRAYFDDAAADGRSEAEVCAALGEPERLARELTAERKLADWEADKSPANMKQALGALAGLGVLNVLLAFPYLFLLTWLGSLWLGAVGLLLAGVVITGSWASHSVFGWPSLDHIVVNDSGVGPWLIAAGPRDGQPPRIRIESEHGETVRIEPDPASGKLVIEARDGDEHFRLERDASGNVAQLQIRDGADSVELSGLPKATSGNVLVFGLVLTVLGLIGSVLGWKVLRWVWHGTGRWLRWQQRLVAGDTAVR